ncbi:MAG: transposase, partial [Acidobacteria bacterium]|nr:transposase [Acidobacteriota bacterium]
MERQLAGSKQNSTNSSKPPSSDGLAGESRQRGRRERCKSRRKPGGQPGHRGHHRRPVPPEQVNEVRDVVPAHCGHCGGGLPANVTEAETTGTTHCHQVVEVPPLAAHIIEYRCHRVVCPRCRHSTRAAVPAEAQRQTGPQLTALIAYLTVTCRMPRRVVEQVLEQVLGIPMSLGNTQACWEEASAATAEPCQQLEQQLPREAVLNVDETGWRTSGQKRYLWAFVAARFVVYAIALTRGSELLIRMLGAVFEGILCSDRFSAYLSYHDWGLILVHSGTGVRRRVYTVGVRKTQNGNPGLQEVRMRLCYSVSLLLALATARPITAQYTTASLGGTVTDSSAAAVPEARITVRNTATGFTQETVSAADGAFIFSRLPLGTYELRVERAGFNTYAQSGIRLTVDQMATQNVVLQVGQLTEQVTVQATQELITTRTATAGQLVEQRQIKELPLQGRRPERLIYLAAGTVDLGRNACRICGHGGVYPGQETAGVNGAGLAQVNFQLDGTSHNDTYLNAGLPFPNPDAVQEFNLQSSNFSAEYGNAAGGIVNIVSRS